MRDNETRRPAPQAEADGLIEGRNAVIEALRAGTAIDKIYLAKARRTRPWAISPAGPGRPVWWWWRRTGGSWTP